MIDSNILVTDTSGYHIRQFRKCDLHSYMRGGGPSIQKKIYEKNSVFSSLNIFDVSGCRTKILLIKRIFSFVKVRFISQNCDYWCIM